MGRALATRRAHGPWSQDLPPELKSDHWWRVSGADVNSSQISARLFTGIRALT